MMPKSSKPRRKYRPARYAARSNRPCLDEAFAVFSPLFNFFDQLEADEVDSARGRVIFREWSGDYC